MIKNLSKKLRENKKKKGFTLIELLIVMAIMVILAAVAVPQLGAYKESANAKSELAAAKTLHTAINSMLADGTLQAPTTGSKEITFSATPAEGTDAKKITEFVSSKDLIGKTKGNTATYFTASIDDNSSIKIKLGTKQIYPQE